MKKKILGLSLVVSVVLILTGIVYANKNLDFFKLGEDVKKINETTTLDIVAKVNGVEIPKSKFDTYKAGLMKANGTFTDEEILDKIIEQEVIIQEIERLGYSVTEEEVNKFNDERFALMDDDPQAYQIIKDYVDGLGITMDEYKEKSKEISRLALLANKYKEEKLKEYENENSQVVTYSNAEEVEKFEDYFNENIEQLKEKANIEIVK